MSEPVKILLRVEEVARMLDIGRYRVFDLINSSDLVSVKIGASGRIPRAGRPRLREPARGRCRVTGESARGAPTAGPRSTRVRTAGGTATSPSGSKRTASLTGAMSAVATSTR
jgi:hypothetical protein